MPMDLLQCSGLLATEAVRHHVDLEQGAIRVVFLTRSYVNARGEKLAVVRVELPDEGCRCRVSLERAFSPGRSAAATCLKLCRLAAETPLVGVEYDAPSRNLRIVAEGVIEDGELTRLQMLSMIDRVVGAAEVWQAALDADRNRRPRSEASSKRQRRGAA